MMQAVSSSQVQVLRDRYLQAQLVGDRRGAIQVLVEEGLKKGASITQLQLEVIQEAQREIGQLWQEDRISVAEVHMATAISQVALAHLFQLATPHAPNGKKIVLACVEGELHDFPARLAADALDLAGFDVRFLGANVSTDSLLSVISTQKPDLVALSVAMVFNIPALRTAVARIRALFGHELPIAVGGYAFTQDLTLCDDLGVNATGSDAEVIVAVARRMLKVH